MYRIAKQRFRALAMYKKVSFLLTVLLLVTGTVSSQNQKIAEVDSTTMAYYQQCLKMMSNPIVISMADTLFDMALMTGDQRMQAVALCTKLDHYYYNSNMEHQQDSIIAWTKRIQHFAKETNQPKYYYFVWGGRLINHYLFRKEYNIALLEAEKMLKEAQEEDYKEGIADCYTTMANIYSAKGFEPQVFEYTLKEIELFEKYNLERYSISLKYGGAAEHFARNGKLAEAEEYLAKGENNANTPYQKAFIKLSRVKCYITAGNLQAAGRILVEAQHIYATNPSLEVRDEALRRAEIDYYCAIKEYDKALTALAAWEKTIQQRQMDVVMIYYYKTKGEIYWEMGRKAEAAEAYRSYIELTQKEKQENEEITTAEIATLLSVHKLSAENRELEKLTKERQLQYTTIIIILLSTILLIVIYFLYRQRRFNRKLQKSRDTLNEKNMILLKAEEELRQAKELAERNSEMKDIFIQNISHEIRTPLNSIVGFTTILSEACPTEEVKSYADTIEKNSQLLLQMINDIIEISDLDRGTREIKFSPVSINECGDQAIEEIRPFLANEVELSFTTVYGDPVVNTDKQLVMQVLNHLLSNAAKFTRTGGISLMVKVDKKKQEVRFMVTDSGIGIPADKQEYIFERFVKLNEFSQGTGLGLSICRLSAEKLNGYLVINKEYTLGTQFVFGIPLQ